jgi:peroxiredoxin
VAKRALSVILEEAFVRCRDLEAPLADRLQAFADEVRRLGPDFAEVIDAQIDRLVQADVGAGAPDVGDAMPPFLLPDEQGRLRGLYDLLSKGPVAIAFHRGQWCPYCRINIHALTRVNDELAGEHRQIAAIVPDRQRFALWLKADAKAPFPVLSDIDNGYAMSLGLSFYVGDEVKQIMINSGWDPSVSQGTDKWLLPIPAAFIVGTNGTVRARFLDPDYRMRMPIEDMIAALRSAD